MTVTIRSQTIKTWVNNDDPFIKVKNIQGEIVRSKEGRTTQRFEIDGKGYYAKLHEGVGWGEVVKNLIQLRLPVIGATNEWLAINRLHELELDTMNGVAFGKKGINPAAQLSFVITEELAETESLDLFAKDWPEKSPSYPLKVALINKVADIARTLHENGINHRDLYICHFLLDISKGADKVDPENLHLHLIDLHRVQIRKKVPRRWLIKDMGSIYFSALDIGLTERDIYRFLRRYFQQPLKQILKEKIDFLKASEARAVKLYKRDFKKEPVLPL